MLYERREEHGRKIRERVIFLEVQLLHIFFIYMLIDYIMLIDILHVFFKDFVYRLFVF